MRFVVSTVFILLTLIGFGQRKKQQDTSAYIQQTNRIEFMDDRLGNEFHIINGGVDGLLVVKETPTRNDGGFGWALYKVDTTLQIIWTKLRIIPSTHYYIGWDYSEGNYYLLFSKYEYRTEDFVLLEISGDNGDINETEISTVFPIELSHFEVIDNTVVFGGITNLKPAVLTVDLEDPKPRVIPGIYEMNSEILDIFINDELRLFTVAMVERMPNKHFTISVRTYTSDNILVQNNNINPGERRNLIDAAPTDFSTGFQYIAGAYSIKSKDYSRGLYLTKFMNGRQQFIKYYNYADLENFFDYLGKNRKNRLKGRITRKKSKGKNKKFNYRLLVHEIIPRGNEYILVGEAFYPRYSNYRTMAPYGMGNFNTFYNRPYSNVIGYKYTHAIVVSFDSKGNILWDHSFPIDDVFLYTKEELVTVNVIGDKIELMYLEDNTIRTKVIERNEILEGQAYTPVYIGSEEDEITRKDPDVEGLENWYGMSQYAYGEQEIQDKQGGLLRNRRKVFYINKIDPSLEQFSN